MPTAWATPLDSAKTNSASPGMSVSNDSAKKHRAGNGLDVWSSRSDIQSRYCHSPIDLIIQALWKFRAATKALVVVTAIAKLGKHPIPKEARALMGIPQRHPRRRAKGLPSSARLGVAM